MWYAKTVDATLEELKVNPETGLSSEEAKKRLEQYGENALKGKPKQSMIALFFAQLKDVLIYVLLGAATITIIIGEYVDAVIILLVVILNAVIGLVQEYKAEKAIEALQKMSIPRALVRRDGEVLEIESKGIVPGDIVVLDAGRYILADLRLIECVNLQIEESTLTGESVPTEKDANERYNNEKIPIGDQANMAYMSTLATYGRGVGVAVATAMETEIGKIARILDEDNDEMTPLQKRLDELGKTLGYVVIGTSLFILIISLFQGRDMFDMFLTAISLAVAAIPEGLAAIVAIVLALGVTRMSKINAIVKKLPAVETLGSVNIICSDKTGTLTQNKMTVVRYYTYGKMIDVPGADSNLEKGAPLDASDDATELIKSLVLCSDATHKNGHSTGDPTEVALVILGERHNLDKTKLEEEYKRVAEKPFDSERKLMSTLNKEPRGFRVHTKGALENLLKISTHVLVDGKPRPLTEEIMADYLRTDKALSNDALRILGVAYKDVDETISSEEMEANLTLIGLVAMIDPPRPEVKASIQGAKAAGITPIMITGDHQNTAVAIAKALGIAESIEQSITGSEIDELSEEEFTRNINNYRVFARVSPEHKVKIVKAFKSHGNIVSMTGDGVNDAPSLKYADIGVAMGITGTDVSKSASDMILTDDNFTTIVYAIEEGRNIYSNIRKSVIFLLSCNLGEVVTIMASIIFFWPVPLLATQILWINLITDTLPAIALGVDPGDKGIMRAKPRDPKESFFANGAGFRVFRGGILIGILTLFGFYFGLHEHGYSLGMSNIPEDVLSYARTIAFAVLAASQLFYSLSMRHGTKSIFQVGLFTNMYLIGAIIIGLLLQVAVISIPVFTRAFAMQNLSPRDWGLVMVLALVPLILSEIAKPIMQIKQRCR